MTMPQSPQSRQRAAYDYLLQRWRTSVDAPTEQRWRYLEAAHVVGQNRLGLHWRAHWQMLRFARQLGDAPEARGQWARLGLTLVGHLVRRLPQGNIGRASVPALRPMVPSVAVRACITEAMQATQPPGTPGASEMSQIDL